MRPSHELARRLCMTAYISLLALQLYWHAMIGTSEHISGALLIWVLPLIALLPGLLKNHIKAYGWVTLLAWFYFTHGVAEWTGPQRAYATAEIILSLAWFGSAVATVRSHPHRKSAIQNS